MGRKRRKEYNPRRGWTLFDRETYHWAWVDEKISGVVRTFVKDLKYCGQRINRGWCDADLYSIHDWFLVTVPSMLEQYKRTRHGNPGVLAENYQNRDGVLVNDTCHEEWDAILERMIFLFHEADELLPVEPNGQHLCTVPERGGVMYKKEDVVTKAQIAALDKVIDITGTTAEYMRQIEAAPILKASGLSEEFKLLADFNGTVLAGQETKYGVQFVTWAWDYGKIGVTHGHYYGPGGVESYIAAKQDFAVRSGLVPGNTLFIPEQLAEVYRSIHETLESDYPITEERQKLLESAAQQIERTVPDLAQRVEQSNQKELEFEPPDAGGMTFC